MTLIHFTPQPGVFAGDHRRFDMRFRCIGRDNADIGQPAVIPLTRPGVDVDDVEVVIAGWQAWALISADLPTVSLDLILARLDAAGLAEGIRR